MTEYYETEYGIHDFTTNEEPLALVTFREREQYIKNFIYENRLRQFIQLDIHTKTGMTFDDYMNKTRYEIESINRIIDENDKLKHKIKESVDRKIERDRAIEEKKSKREMSK